MMRIITGRARGVRLTAPEGEHTRPTAERVKEAVFSMLQFELEERQVLDLFAGSGQLGLEAVSRGAAHAVLVDSSRAAAEVIRRNCGRARLQDCCEVLCADAVGFLRGCAGRRRFDLVFLDPPYAAGLVPVMLRLLTDGEILPVGGTAVCETAAAADVFAGDAALASHFLLLRQTRYGAACVTLLRRTDAAPARG